MGGSVCYHGRRRWRKSAARRSSGEEIGRTGLTIRRGRRGEMKRRPRASHRKKRHFNWCCKSSGIKEGREIAMSCNVRTLRPEDEDADDVSMTSSVFLFLISVSIYNF